MAGKPATVVLEPGQEHHNPAVDEKFVAAWIEEIVRRRMPAAISVGQTVSLVSQFAQVAFIGRYTPGKDAASPWSGGERAVSIAIDSRAAYTGTEPWIWLPSERLAKAWKTFMETGKFVEP